MLDLIYVVFENAGKWFPTYDEAWKNHYKSHVKKVQYVFTPTEQVCPTVSQLEKVARDYFNRTCGLDYLNVLNSEGYKQLKIIGDK